MVGRLIAIAAVLGLSVPVEAQHRSSSIRTAAVTADLSYLSAAGNSSSSMVSFAEQVHLSTINDRFRFAQAFRAVHGRSDDVESIDKYSGNVRFDYRLVRNVYLMGLIGWERDLRNGIRQRWGETLGLHFEYSIAQADILSVEVGATAFQQRDVIADSGGLDGNTAAGHLAGRFKHIFSKDTYFAQSLELLPNFTVGKGFRTVTESEAYAQVSNMIGLKLQYLVLFSNRPSLEPGSATGARLAKTDRLFLAGLSFSF